MDLVAWFMANVGCFAVCPTVRAPDKDVVTGMPSVSLFLFFFADGQRCGRYRLYHGVLGEGYLCRPNFCYVHCREQPMANTLP